jgi:ParB family chromosome partitioning protein
MSAIAAGGQIEQELADTKRRLTEAEQRLDDYKGRGRPALLDPTTIARSDWANRDLSNFSGPGWDAFKEELASAGGNVQPIKVRVVQGTVRDARYEVVYGHRRHQGCLELGLPVFCIVEDQLSDPDLFIQMDRENRHRKDLSAYEQGQSYTRALDKGLFRSQRHLAESLGVNLSDVSRACALAKLPHDIIAAFNTPLDLQVRFAKPLGDALQRDPEGVLGRARDLQRIKATLSVPQILAKLLGSEGADGRVQDLLVNGSRVGAVKVGRKGDATIEIGSGVLSEDRRHRLIALLQEFLSQA